MMLRMFVSREAIAIKTSLNSALQSATSSLIGSMPRVVLHAILSASAPVGASNQRGSMNHIVSILALLLLCGCSDNVEKDLAACKLQAIQTYDPA